MDNITVRGTILKVSICARCGAKHWPPERVADCRAYHQKTGRIAKTESQTLSTPSNHPLRPRRLGRTKREQEFREGIVLRNPGMRGAGARRGQGGR